MSDRTRIVHMMECPSVQMIGFKWQAQSTASLLCIMIFDLRPNIC